MIIKTILPVLLVQKQSCQDEEHPNFSLFSLCVTVSSCFFPKAEKRLVLKSGISLQQRNFRLNSRRNIFVMLPIIVYLVYHHQTISAIELLLFWSWKWRHENSLHNMAPLSSCWLAEYGKWRESCLLIGDTNGQYGYVKSCALQGLPAFNSAQKRPVAALNTL